jgi:hypothetical protein
MTRRWIKLVSSGEGTRASKITKLEEAMKRFNVREAFHRAFLHDNMFGMGIIYPDLVGACRTMPRS